MSVELLEQLLEAANTGDPGRVRAMLDSGANAADVHPAAGWTALMVAAQGGHLEAARVLLSRGAQVNAATHKGSTALTLAAKNGRKDMAALLLDSGADVNQPDRTGITPLMNAAGGGHAAVVALLLERGARPDLVETQIGANALLAGSISGNSEVVALLVPVTPDLNFRNHDGFTALHYCAARGDLAAVKLLLAKGAQPNVLNAHGEAPLIRAAAAGRAEVAQALLEAGAAIDATSREGLTALMVAADQGHLPVVKVLLARGANKELRSLGLRTAGDYARFKNFTEIEELLVPPPQPVARIQARPASPEEQKAATRRLIDATWSKDLAAATRALEDGASLQGQGDDIPLVVAAHAGATDIVRLLLVNGAPVDAADSTGLTALVKACGGCHVGMARALLEHGAKLNKDVFFAASIREHPGILALLEEAAKKPQ